MDNGCHSLKCKKATWVIHKKSNCILDYTKV